MEQGPIILFTAFERSGDDHAAAVIRALKARRPELRIYGLGGEKMAAAGAEILEETVGGAVMGMGAIGQWKVHRARVKRLGVWMRDHAVDVHVPTDSPAANWAVCKLVKSKPWGELGDGGAGKVVHLVAPQLWAWASWRIGRLHKWSDRLLCVLPFEEKWFGQRGVKTRFIGHPLFDEAVDEGEVSEVVDRLGVGVDGGEGDSGGEGEIRIGLLPGSRKGEVLKNWPVMREVFERLRARFPQARGVVAAADEAGAKRIEEIGLGDGLRIEVGEVEGVLGWSEVVLTVSGTVTLRVARAGKPMVALYKVGGLFWRLIGWWLINTRTFTLPNLVARGGPSFDGEGHVVKEFVPWLGGDVGPIAEELAGLIEDKDKRERQVAALGAVMAKFETGGGSGGVGEAAAEEILAMLDGKG